MWRNFARIFKASRSLSTNLLGSLMPSVSIIQISVPSSYPGLVLLSDKDMIDLRKVNDNITLVSTEALAHNKNLRKALADLDIPRIHDQLSELTKNLESQLAHFFIVRNIADTVLGSKKLELLQWLSKIPYSKHHESVRSGRLEGSGLWLFEHPQYVQWRKSRSSSLLWLHGNRKCFPTRDAAVSAQMLICLQRVLARADLCKF